MPDQDAKESIDLTLGGETWHLRLGPKELSTVDRAFGPFGTMRAPGDPPVNPLELLDKLVADFDPEHQTWKLGSVWALHVLFWAALKRERPEITLNQAGELMAVFDGNLAELAMLVRMAWQVGGLGTARNAPKNAEAEATAQRQ